MPVLEHARRRLLPLIAVAAALSSCLDGAHCLRYSDCADGLTCADGRCVPPAGGSSGSTAPPAPASSPAPASDAGDQG